MNLGSYLTKHMFHQSLSPSIHGHTNLMHDSKKQRIKTTDKNHFKSNGTNSMCCYLDKSHSKNKILRNFNSMLRFPMDLFQLLVKGKREMSQETLCTSLVLAKIANTISLQTTPSTIQCLRCRNSAWEIWVQNPREEVCWASHALSSHHCYEDCCGGKEYDCSDSLDEKRGVKNIIKKS